jgi:hypothetical protein
MRNSLGFIVLSIALFVIGPRSGWAQGGSGTCDRSCLESLVDRYLDAVIAHDPKQLPLARDVKWPGRSLDMATRRTVQDRQGEDSSD